jgi:hypothetical protein
VVILEINLLFITHLDISLLKCIRVILEVAKGLAAELLHVPVFYTNDTTLLRIFQSIRLGVSANDVVDLILIQRVGDTLIHLFQVFSLVLTQLAQVYPVVVLNQNN